MIALLGVAHDRKPLPAKRRETLACRAGRHREVARLLRVLVRGRVGERREEGEEIHAHRHESLGECLVRFQEERLAPVGRTKLVKFLVELEPLDRLLRVGDAFHLIGSVVPHLTAISENRVHRAHHERIVRVVGVYCKAIAFLLRPVEELSDVAQLRPGFGHVQLIAVLGFEGRLFF